MLAPKLFIKGQKRGQENSAPCNRLLNAKNPNLSYSYLHIECYYFCRQCKNHFDTAEGMELKHISFTTLFLHNRVKF